jgi:hypothetical protein
MATAWTGLRLAHTDIGVINAAHEFITALPRACGVVRQYFNLLAWFHGHDGACSY